MALSLALAVEDSALYLADWRELRAIFAAPARPIKALFVDAPYSERTHGGHGNAKDELPDQADDVERRALNYGFWTPDDVAAFVRSWSPLVDGWFGSITDHVLFPAWEAALLAEGRMTFAPIPLIVRGSTVRMAGDGPSSWTTWLCVARPRTPEMKAWGTLPGEYTLPTGADRKKPVVGGKPAWIMERIVEDYSRPGDLVVDPCCGGGTTLVAAIRAGRQAIGGDVNAEHVAIASEWLRNPLRRAPGRDREEEARAKAEQEGKPPPPQGNLFGGGR